MSIKNDNENIVKSVLVFTALLTLMIVIIFSLRSCGKAEVPATSQINPYTVTISDGEIETCYANFNDKNEVFSLRMTFMEDDTETNMFKYGFEYDANHNMTKMTTYGWDEELSAWVNDDYTKYGEYLSNNGKVISYSIFDSDDEKVADVVCEYEGGKLISETTKYADETYHEYVKWVYEYEDDKLVKMTKQSSIYLQTPVYSNIYTLSFTYTNGSLSKITYDKNTNHLDLSVNISSADAVIPDIALMRISPLVVFDGMG